MGDKEEKSRELWNQGGPPTHWPPGLRSLPDRVQGSLLPRCIFWSPDPFVKSMMPIRIVPRALFSPGG